MSFCGVSDSSCGVLHLRGRGFLRSCYSGCRRPLFSLLCVLCVMVYGILADEETVTLKHDQVSLHFFPAPSARYGRFCHQIPECSQAEPRPCYQHQRLCLVIQALLVTKTSSNCSLFGRLDSSSSRGIYSYACSLVHWS
jgi:hypothetical protein